MPPMVSKHPVGEQSIVDPGQELYGVKADESPAIAYIPGSAAIALGVHV